MQQSAAAFARLCVETANAHFCRALTDAAAFARLCVETIFKEGDELIIWQPPSRGCVLKHCMSKLYLN